jgi:hypothetical protein
MIDERNKNRKHSIFYESFKFGSLGIQFEITSATDRWSSHREIVATVFGDVELDGQLHPVLLILQIRAKDDDLTGTQLNGFGKVRCTCNEIELGTAETVYEGQSEAYLQSSSDCP